MQTLGILKDDFYNLKSISLNYFCSKEPLNKKYLYYVPALSMGCGVEERHLGMV